MPAHVILGLALLASTTTSPARLTVSDIAEHTAGSVALIATSDADGKAVATGSGVFLTSDGILVTNRHVVDDAATAIVKLPNGAFYAVKGFVAVDRRNDLILLKVDGIGFKSVRLTPSAGVRLGEEVVAIGSPLALEGTISTGIVSGIRNDLEVERAIQTTAPISHGSSGGALLDMRGRVVGITTFQAKEGQNLNFAVASELVQRLLSQPRTLHDLSDLKVRVNLAAFLTEQPQLWVHTLDASEWSIRRVGTTIYAQLVLPDRFKDLGLYHSCKYDYSTKDDAWWGSCKSKLPVRCETIKTCDIEVFDSFTSLQPDRLSGYSPKLEGLGCDCVPKLSEKVHEFALVPKAPTATEATAAQPTTASTTALSNAISPSQSGLPVAAAIQGQIVSQTDSTTTFSWELQLTSSSSRFADAEIQFLDSNGFAVTTSKERGLQLPAGTPATFRGTTEVPAAIAAKVVRFGVKVVAHQ